MSPATLTLPAETDTAPFETRSPTTFSVPVPLTLIAFPPVPPQPSPSRAATVGVYRRLFTLPCAPTPSVGLVPLVRTRPNWSWSDLVAVSMKRLPCGPITRATSVRTLPSENVHVTVHGDDAGVPYPEHEGALYRRRFVPKMLVAACSAPT